LECSRLRAETDLYISDLKYHAVSVMLDSCCEGQI